MLSLNTFLKEPEVTQTLKKQCPLLLMSQQTHNNPWGFGGTPQEAGKTGSILHGCG